MNTNRHVFRNNTSAPATSLTGMSRIDGNNRNTSAFSLVFQHVPEYAKTSVMRRQRKMSVAVHERERQVFNCNQVVRFNQTLAFLMKVASALMFNVFVQSGDVLIGLALPHAPLDLPTGMALKSAKFRKVPSQPMWVLDTCSSRKHGNVFQPNVHANLSARRLSGDVRIRHIHRKRNIPALVPSSNTGVFHPGILRNTAVITNSHLTHILYIKSVSAIVACSQCTAITVGVFNRIEAIARFETRETRFLSRFQSTEKCGIRLIKTAKRLLQTGHIDQTQRIRIVSSKVSEVLPLRMVRHSLATFLVHVDSLFEGKIVDTPMLLDHTCERFFLVTTWSKEVPICPQHRSARPLLLNVFLDNFLRRHSHGTDIVASAPKAWEAGTQLRKFLAQRVGRVSLELVGKALWRFCRIAFNTQVDVIWHHFESFYRCSEVLCFFVKQSTQFLSNLAHTYVSSVLWAPHNVIFQGVNASSIASVSCICHRTSVRRHSYFVKYLTLKERRAAGTVA